MRATVVCSMRNEGAFLLEWVVWQRMLGFTDIVAVTNDCTDRSAGLLGALERAGWVTALDCDLKAGQAGISSAKYAAAGQLEAVRRADWVMVCDVDEFLVIHRGAGLLPDLLAAPDRDFLGMSINWRTFGAGGVRAYQDAPVHRQFTACVRREAGVNSWVKSIFRRPDWFRRLREHGPYRIDMARVRAETGLDWGQGGLVWITPSGAEIAAWQPEGDYLQNHQPPEHHVAQINHYMLRSAETFSLKAGTPSPTAAKDRYTDQYWTRANRAEERDSTALRHAARFDALWAEAMALPEVARWHDLCCADHVAAIARVAGRDPAGDARHAAFLARAAGR